VIQRREVFCFQQQFSESISLFKQRMLICIRSWEISRWASSCLVLRAPGQLVMVQTVSPPGEGVWKAQAPFLTDNYGCVAIATQAPLAGNDRDMDALGHFWSPFQNRGDLNYRETQQFAPWIGMGSMYPARPLQSSSWRELHPA
jgi:hypothetical protein